MTINEWIDGAGRDDSRQSAYVPPEIMAAISRLRDARQLAGAVKRKEFIDAYAFAKALLQKFDDEI